MAARMHNDHDSGALEKRFRCVREATVALIEGLEPEDMVVQTMPDVSPTKWHLAHTTWFFEEFVLAVFAEGYRRYRPGYDFLFNSYYNQVGPMHRRAWRGYITRPTLTEILSYREHVDEAVYELLSRSPGHKSLARIELGCEHERQHQELLVTDIKHVLSQNPLAPAWRSLPAPDQSSPGTLTWTAQEGGIVEVGHAGEGFAFDNESPRHRVYLEHYELADRPVSNAEFAEFIADGGYRTPALWLSDGWARVQSEGWQRPLYWREDDASEFTVAGVRALEPSAPVSHLSYYEADAFAHWAGARLPTEAEWEHGVRATPREGNFSDSGRLHPAPCAGRAFWGNVWEWTGSAYLPYPGYRPPRGAIGEYNGKFMIGQMVLRGGSCATPLEHIRATYRNFFYPHQRWQFTGLRLAK